jgi:2-keto-4-pentenoate hydratase/2-oxohepta-3-ene-1,7-dioic acid hydratase in catechol pathway
VEQTRIARCLVDGRPRYGSVVDDRIRLLDGSPFEEAVRESEVELALSGVSLLTPVAPTKILAIGRNYANHAAEMGLKLPSEPAVFLKPGTSLLPPGGTVVLPPARLSTEVEHEAELAVVIGRTARRVSRSEALGHVFGYTCANDVSARDIQRSDTHITRAKGFDTFCPLGPWIVTDVDPGELRVRCRVNGEVRQDGSTRDLIFDVPTVISFLSQWTTLEPGDVILTGSPAGTGPLRAGDNVEIDVEGIGVLAHSVAAS